MKKPTLFDVINHINEKSDTRDDDLVSFDQFMMNRAYSMRLDTIMFANEMNVLTSLSNSSNKDFVDDMVYDFYYSMVPKGRVFAKWAKSSKDESVLINAIMNKYKVNRQMAVSYTQLIDDNESALLIRGEGGKQ